MISQTISVPKDSYEIFTIENVFNLEASVDSDLPLIYESKNNSILNVDAEGNIFINNSGKTLVRIYNRGNNIWEPVEKYIFFDIKKKKQDIKFFLIPNLYAEETANFSLSSYGFSTSGLPLKYRSLNTKIADIDENGGVIIYNVGTVVFEAYQEGDFEWDSVKTIQEFGVSFRRYPFDLELTSRKPNTLIQFNLFQKNNNKFTLFDNLSGGLYFGETKYALEKQLLLPTGEYIGLLNYQNIPSGNDAFSTLNTFYSFSTGIYVGKKQDKNLAFIIKRFGFISYGTDVIVQAIFNEGNGYKYTSTLALESGIFWSGSFAPDKDELIFFLPLFFNNKIEYEIGGQLQFAFINNEEIPSYLTQITGFESAIFNISTGDVQSTIPIVGSGILPYFPKDLGLDFKNFNPASFSLDSYPKF